MSEDKKTCYKCAYKRNVAGSAHSSCHFNWDKSENTPPEGDEHGIRKGWYMFPFNYDPIWQTSECKEFSLTQNDEMVDSDNGNPFLMILKMFRR